MNFNWINLGNLASVVCLIVINIVAVRKGVSENFCSKYTVINIFEQIGRYGSMVLMIFPFFTKGWKFGFMSVIEMLIWVCATVLLLVIYGLLWMKKSAGGVGILYGLAIVPVILFLLNGILLRHFTLVVASLIFGVFHCAIVRENLSNIAHKEQDPAFLTPNGYSDLATTSSEMHDKVARINHIDQAICESEQEIANGAEAVDAEVAFEEFR